MKIIMSMALAALALTGCIEDWRDDEHDEAHYEYENDGTFTRTTTTTRANGDRDELSFSQESLDRLRWPMGSGVVTRDFDRGRIDAMSSSREAYPQEIDVHTEDDLEQALAEDTGGRHVRLQERIFVTREMRLAGPVLITSGSPAGVLEFAPMGALKTSSRSPYGLPSRCRAGDSRRLPLAASLKIQASTVNLRLRGTGALHLVLESPEQMMLDYEVQAPSVIVSSGMLPTFVPPSSGLRLARLATAEFPWQLENSMLYPMKPSQVFVTDGTQPLSHPRAYCVNLARGVDYERSYREAALANCREGRWHELLRIFESCYGEGVGQ